MTLITGRLIWLYIFLLQKKGFTRVTMVTRYLTLIYYLYFIKIVVEGSEFRKYELKTKEGNAVIIIHSHTYS